MEDVRWTLLWKTLLLDIYLITDKIEFFLRSSFSRDQPAGTEQEQQASIHPVSRDIASIHV